MKIKVIHIINTFGYGGGAEAMLYSLLACTDRERFELMVVSLTDSLSLAERVEALGIPVRGIGMRPGVPDPRGVVRLARLLHRERPGVIQTWMYHSNLIGGIAARLSVPAPVVWGIHHVVSLDYIKTKHDARAEKRTTLWTLAIGARLSHRLPARIVCCSESARQQHERMGYATEKLMVIPNAFDTGTFRPDPTARFEVRRELGIGPDTLLVGRFARYATQKDYPNFFRAAAILKDRCPGVHFVLCGDRMDEANAELVSGVEAHGLRGRCHLLGIRRDMPRLTASLDLAVQSSITEAFPLVIGEALACGVPCVATDVGDSAAIIGESGRIVPPRDPQALAAACQELLELSPEARAQMGQSGRLRIQKYYELASITRRYEDLYEALGTGGGWSTAPVLPSAGPAPGYEVSHP
jgi:glycosyltransferase involved in cell wall biosynthesis